MVLLWCQMLPSGTKNNKRPEFISGRLLFFTIKEKDKPVQVPFF